MYTILHISPSVVARASFSVLFFSFSLFFLLFLPCFPFSLHYSIEESIPTSTLLLDDRLKIILIPNTIGNRKRDCAWGRARGIDTTWENLQIEKHKSVRWAERTPSWFVLFDLQIFSGGVYPSSATSRTIAFSIFNSFGINLIHFFDFFDEQKNGAAGNSIVCFAVSIPCHAPFDSAKNANCFEECNVFGNGKCELNAIKVSRDTFHFPWKRKFSFFSF